MDVNHTTVFRWVQVYGPELEKRCRPHLKPTNDSWRVDETYVKAKGEDRYLYRAVDSEGNANPLYPPSKEGGQMLLRLALDFLLTAKRDSKAVKRFLYKMLSAVHTQAPRVINVDKSPAYPKAVNELKAKEELAEQVELRQKKYLNNRVEQDYQFIKRLVKPVMGFGSFNTARRTLKGDEHDS